MSNAVSFMFRAAPRCTVFTERIGWVTISSQTRCSLSMPGQESGFRHFQGVHQEIWDTRFSLPYGAALISTTAFPLIWWRKQPSRGTCIYSTVPMASRSFLSRNGLTRRATFQEKLLRRRNLRPPRLRRSPGRTLTQDLLTTRTPEAHEKAVKEFAKFRSGGQFIPIGLNQETVVFPCFLGGAEWGGPAVDRMRGVIYVNANEMACVLGLTENRSTVGYRRPGFTTTIAVYVRERDTRRIASALRCACRCGEATDTAAD